LEGGLPGGFQQFIHGGLQLVDINLRALDL
jgi:hypothetical protein